MVPYWRLFYIFKFHCIEDMEKDYFNIWEKIPFASNSMSFRILQTIYRKSLHFWAKYTNQSEIWKSFHSFAIIKNKCKNISTSFAAAPTSGLCFALYFQFYLTTTFSNCCKALYFQSFKKLINTNKLNKFLNVSSWEDDLDFENLFCRLLRRLEREGQELYSLWILSSENLFKKYYYYYAFFYE